MFRGEVLSDDLWARLEPLLPPVKGPMGKPMKPHRPVVEGMLYRLRTGLAWRDLPEQFGPWQTGRVPETTSSYEVTPTSGVPSRLPPDRRI